MGGAEMPDWLPWAVNFTACLATGILFRVHAIDERVKEIKRELDELAEREQQGTHKCRNHVLECRL